MFTIIWAIVFLVVGNTALSIGTPAFWGLVIALIADFVWWSPVGRKYLIVR